MKKTLLALVLVFVLICSFACAPATAAPTAGTTAVTTVAPPNIAESEWLLLAMPEEISEGYFEWNYKTVTNAEDIDSVAALIDSALETATKKDSLAESELATSKDVRARIRLSSCETVHIYGDGIYAGEEYEADTVSLISSLAEIYERTDSEEQPWT